MTKVLIVATSKYTRGGITAVIKQHQKGEQWKKFHCTWIGYHIDRSAALKLFFLCQALIRYVVLLPFFQIVHFQFSLRTDAKRTRAFFVLAKLHHKKTIVHLHCGDQLPEIWNETYEYLFTNADLILVLSESIKKKVQGYIGKEYPIEVLYNPCVTLDETSVFEKRKKEILFAGKLDQNKGWYDVINAFSKIASKYKDWKLVFAGNGEVEQAKALAKQNGISKQCDFLGWVNGEQKKKAFLSASGLCLASYAEGFPMAVLDAWAYGVPVITTPVGGIPDIAEDGKNLLLFNSGDVNTLASQMEKFICNEELRKQLSDESIHLAKTIFNEQTINKQLTRIYQELS